MRRIAFLFLAIVCTSCSTPPTTEPTITPPVEFPTPRSAILGWASAYHWRNIDIYTSTLDATYRFVIEGTAGPELELTREEDIAYTDTLFACIEGADVNVEFDEPVPSEVPGFPADEGYLHVPVTAVNARIQTRHGPAGDPLIELIAGGSITIVVQEGADRDWRIVYVEVPAEHASAWRPLKLAEVCDAP